MQLGISFLSFYDLHSENRRLKYRKKKLTRKKEDEHEISGPGKLPDSIFTQ